MDIAQSTAHNARHWCSPPAWDGSMHCERVVLDLIGKIYAAGLEPTLWPAFLDSLRNELGGNTVALAVHDLRTIAGNLSHSIGLDPEAAKQYDEHFAARNIVLQRGADLLAPGKVVTERDLCPERDLLASEYYNDYLRLYDMRHMLGGSVLQRNSIAAILTVLRPHRRRPFGKQEQVLLETLMPHLQRSLQMHQRFTMLEHSRNALANAVDRISTGVVIVSVLGRVDTLNANAERIVRENDGITLEQGKLVAQKHRENQRLQHLVHTASATATGKSMAPGDWVLISRPSGRRSYALLVCPLRQNEDIAPTLQSRALRGAIVFITDPENEAAPHSELLAYIFGLSVAEARLALLLLQGKSLAEAATEIAVGVNTVRTQLRAIFSKTNTSRQGELVALLSRTLGNLRQD